MHEFQVFFFYSKVNISFNSIVHENYKVVSHFLILLLFLLEPIHALLTLNLPSS